MHVLLSFVVYMIVVVCADDAVDMTVPVVDVDVDVGVVFDPFLPEVRSRQG